MYTQDLIDEVKELYPDSEEMIEHAEKGSAILGRYLDDSSGNSISLDSILSSVTLEYLQAKARLMQRKNDLYHKWSKQDPRV